MDKRIEVTRGDITTYHVDAIVNAANSRLAGGGGVDGAIHRVGGAIITEECAQIRKQKGGCTAGEAVMTSAGNLPAKKVIHTVGPIYREREDRSTAKILAQCYQSSLDLASSHKLKSVSFPNISTGVYGYPKEKAAEIAIKTVRSFLKTNRIIEQVLFVCFDEENFEIYKSIMNKSDS